MTGPAATGGLFQSLRRLLDTGVEIVQVRLELFGSELEQEKLRLFDAVVLAAVGLVLASLALVLAIAFVVLLFQEGYRLPAVGVLTLLFAGGGWLLLHRAREELKAGDGGPFALTLGELRRDRSGLTAAEAPRDES
jgi:uncharacterized membrane protein YqjE